MSSLYDDLPVVPAPTAPTPAARPLLRVVPDVPLDFEDAVSRLTPRLVRYAARRLNDRHEAEEVVQEALLRAYKNRAALLTEDDLTAWSTCVTGRLVIDRLRVRGRSTSVADVPEGSRVGRDTADVVVARDEARTALDALDAMPARQAAVLWAREVEGLPYDQIGARFGMTEPAVRSILTRARKALRKEYAARGGTLPAAGGVIGILAPWAEGFSWLDKLRQSATRLAGPAALGVVGTALLGSGFLLAPSTAPAATLPPIERSVVSEPLDAGAPTAKTVVPATPARATAVAVTQQPAKRLPARTERPRSTFLGVVIPPAPCGAQTDQGERPLPTGNGLGVVAGVGAEECGKDYESAFVSVTAPNGPTVGTDVQGVTCDQISAVPVVKCEPSNPEGAQS